MIDFIKNLFVKDDEEDLLTKLPDSVVLLNNQGSFLWHNDLAQKSLSAIKENFAKVETISTASTWHGVTYKKDSAVLKDALNKLVSEKDYPNKLWEE